MRPTSLRPSISALFHLLTVLVVSLLVLPNPAHAQFGQDEHVTVSTQWWQEAVRPGGQNVLAVVFDMAPDWHIASDEAQGVEGGFEPMYTVVNPSTDSQGVTIGSPQYPKPHVMKLGSLPDPIAVFDGKAVVYIPVSVDADTEPGQLDIQLAITYQACDDQSCDFPKNIERAAQLAVSVEGDTDGGDNTADAELFAGFDFETFGSITEAPPTQAATETIDFFVIEVDPSGTAGFVLLLLLAAVGGALLNFTPCVLPVIPIKILGLAQTAGNRRKTLALGATMSLGVVAFWLGLGVAIAFVSGFTASNQLFQYPAFSITVGAIIAVMAVGMCGLFAIRLPNFVYSVSPKHDSYPGSFGFGIMTAVLSTPCTAPLMAAAAAWAALQTPTITLVTFTAIGVGMALPYLILSANPKLVDALPRTGPGSELLKQVMGLLMLAAAVFFIGAGISGMLSDGTEAAPKGHWWVVSGMVSLAGLWMMMRIPKATPSTTKRGVFIMLSVATIVSSTYAGYALTRPDKWTYYTPQRFEQALTDGNVVLLDFTADWCANCHLLENTVLDTEPVQAILQSDGYVAMKIDLTGGYPDGKTKLQESGSVMIPWLVIYSPDGEEAFKANWYTATQLINELKQAKTN